jgi:hypothetical protein
MSTITIGALPPGIRGFRFYSGRPIPIGTTFKTTVFGPLTVVEGSVPHGPHVVTPCSVVDGEIVLDDGLWFEHEMKPIKVQTLNFEKVV